MKTITIQILAEDIKNSDYINPKDCAMTRAFKRAGLPFREAGGDIWVRDTNNFVMITPQELEDKVVAMYKYTEVDEWQSDDDSKIVPIEPQDFTFELELPDNYAN